MWPDFICDRCNRCGCPTYGIGRISRKYVLSCDSHTGSACLCGRLWRNACEFARSARCDEAFSQRYILGCLVHITLIHAAFTRISFLKTTSFDLLLEILTSLIADQDCAISSQQALMERARRIHQVLHQLGLTPASSRHAPASKSFVASCFCAEPAPVIRAPCQ